MGRGRRLLVLGAGPAQAGVLAAARRRGLTVVAADRDPGAPGFPYAHRRALVSIEDEPAVERLARAEDVDAVVAPGSDGAVPLAARIAHRLRLPHPLGPDAALLASSRRRQRGRLAEAGIPQPRGLLCRSPKELAAAVEAFGRRCSVEPPPPEREDPWLVEELPAGGAVSVVGFVEEGRFVPLAGAAGVGDEGARLAAAAAAALGIEDGLVTARVLLAAEGPLLARLSAHAGGAPEADDLVVAAALGERLAAAVKAA